ncbi:MAG: hypothetical protein ABL977_09850 [Candidatus Eisenbacteria bacterium]
MSLVRTRTPRSLVCCTLLLAATACAGAEWLPVEAIVGTPVFALIASGDTLIAGANGVLWTSVDAGFRWSAPRTLPVAGRPVQALLWHAGRIYAGASLKGVFVSDDFGVTWSAFNTGLTGGFQDSQLDVTDLELQDGTLYAATAGAGVYARRLVSGAAWAPFGVEFEIQQAANVRALESDGTRLLASAGVNGMVFVRDPGNPDWVESDLDNVGVHAGLAAETAVFTGTGWIVGSNIGIFRSPTGAEPWTRTSLGLGPVDWSAFALAGTRVYGAFSFAAGALVMQSTDDGATWAQPDFQPGAFVIRLALSGGSLFAARTDGLWVRSAPELASPAPTPAALRGLRVEAAAPAGGRVRVKLECPGPGRATISVLDVLGRRIGERLEFDVSAGVRSLELDTTGLPSGHYLLAAHLDGATASARFSVI